VKEVDSAVVKVT